MPKKTKLGKGRLDKYYHIAKQQGYRSRASFKLIQINKKYQFLNKAQAVIDLCAAPGGWLQVCEKFCPYGSQKIGVDLDRIPPIPGCRTFQEDITTQKCFSILKKELNGKKADVVLNDGAPNTGQNWNKDAFAQIELTLSALRLACNFLKRGGVFVTKVFRSTDYNALVYIMKKFFKRVEANKPLASRFASAEIFVCCLDFIAPDIIDDKLFDPKYVFKDTEFDIQQKNTQIEINSVDKILEKRRRRQGYDDNAPQMLSKKLTFQEFIDIENPFAVFVTHNQIGQPSEKLKTIVQAPEFFDEYLDDLAVLGRREIGALIKWRGKIRQKLRSEKQQSHKIEQEEEDSDMEEEQEQIKVTKIGEEGEDQGEDDSDAGKWESGEEEESENENIQEEDSDEEEDSGEESEQDEEIRKLQKKELNEQRKKREKKNKQITKQGISTEFTGNLEDEELFNMADHKKLKKMEYIETNDDEFEPKVNKIRMTQKDIEENIERIYENKKNKTSKKQRLLNDTDMPLHPTQEKNLQCETLEGGQKKKKKKSSDQIEEEQEQEKFIKSKLASNSWFDRDVFKGLGGIEEEKETVFINPITKERVVKRKQDDENLDDVSEDSDEIYEEQNKDQDQDQDQEEDDDQDEDDDYESDDESNDESDDQEDESEEEESDDGEQIDDMGADVYIDKKLLEKRSRMEALSSNMQIDQNEKFKGEKEGEDAYKIKVPKTERELRKEKLKKQQKRQEKKKAKDDINEMNIPIEVVPEARIEDYDMEELAETMAMAKKMIRNRSREQIIDSTYSRYATNEEEEDLPDWFTEDEKKHNFKHLPVTKEEIKAEMEKIKAINNRAPKKVLEAKIRKQKRLDKKMKRAHEKANEIFEQEGVSESMKIIQAKKLYAKQVSQVKNEKEKKMVFAKKFKSGKVNQGSKKVKYVDARAKSDVKNTRKLSDKQKAMLKKGKGQPGNGGKAVSRKRQVHRRKRKTKQH